MLPRCACGFQMPGPLHGRDCKLYDRDIYKKLSDEEYRSMITPPPQMTPPDSDAVRLQMALAVLREMADPQPAIAEADAKTRAHWMQSCARHALVKLSDAAQPDFSLIRKDLAQCILAALESMSTVEDPLGDEWTDPEWAGLRDELRAVIGK